MKQLNEAIAKVEKQMKLKADIKPERMKILEDFLKGKITHAEAIKEVQRQFDDAE